MKYNSVELKLGDWLIQARTFSLFDPEQLHSHYSSMSRVAVLLKGELLRHLVESEQLRCFSTPKFIPLLLAVISIKTTESVWLAATHTHTTVFHTWADMLWILSRSFRLHAFPISPPRYTLLSYVLSFYESLGKLLDGLLFSLGFTPGL